VDEQSKTGNKIWFFSFYTTSLTPPFVLAARLGVDRIPGMNFNEASNLADQIARTNVQQQTLNSPNEKLF
jgi:hypothetical protein